MGEINPSMGEQNLAGQPGEMHKPKIAQVSFLYTISTLVLLFIGSRVQKSKPYSAEIAGILITEFVLILIPPLFLLLFYKYNLKAVLRLNKVKISNMVLVFFIMVSAIPLVGILNGINLLLIKYIFGKTIIAQPPVANNGVELIINILVIGGSAGICEEVLFRGTIQRGFEKIGVVKAILITSFLFGLMHLDFQKLLGTFLLGALIGFIVYRTDSLFAGMFAHFTNNSIAVVMAFGTSQVTKMTKGLDLNNLDKMGTSLETLPKELIIAAIIGWILILFCVVVFPLLMIVFTRRTSENTENVRGNAGRIEKRGALLLLPGVLSIGFIYFAEGLKLTGHQMPVIDNILRIVGMK